MFKSWLEKPFRLLSVVGCIYLFISILLKLLADFPQSNNYYPLSKIISVVIEGIALVLCVLAYFFYDKHFLYFTGLELVVFGNLYNGTIYTALFLSSILLVLQLSENRIITPLIIWIYSGIEIIKAIMVIPYGVTEFFYYVGLTLFALCTIGCVNLLFRHAYSKKESGSINLDEMKLSDRQKDCIKEIVMNNTTIKALSINHNVSESAIKKDLAGIYKIFGISGKADLKALFIGYKF